MRKTLIIVLIAIIAVIGIGATAFSISKSVFDPYEQQIKLGYKFLAEGQYEEAILAFDKAITIEAKRDKAYIGKADTYLAISGEDMVTMINESLRTGYEMTQSNRIVDAYIRLSDELIDGDKTDIALKLLRLGYEVTESAKLKEKIEELINQMQNFTPNEIAKMEAVYQGMIREDYEFLYDYINKSEFAMLFDDTTRMERLYDEWKLIWLSEHGEVTLLRSDTEPYSYDIEFGSRENGTNYRLWFNSWDEPHLFLYIVDNKNGLGNGQYRNYEYINNPNYVNNISIESGTVVNGLLEGTETEFMGHTKEYEYTFFTFYENGIELDSNRNPLYGCTNHIGGYYDNNDELQYSHNICIE